MFGNYIQVSTATDATQLVDSGSQQAISDTNKTNLFMTTATFDIGLLLKYMIAKMCTNFHSVIVFLTNVVKSNK